MCVCHIRSRGTTLLRCFSILIIAKAASFLIPCPFNHLIVARWLSLFVYAAHPILSRRKGTKKAFLSLFIRKQVPPSRLPLRSHWSEPSHTSTLNQSFTKKTNMTMFSVIIISCEIKGSFQLPKSIRILWHRKGTVNAGQITDKSSITILSIFKICSIYSVQSNNV